MPDPLERSWSLRRAILQSPLDAESKCILFCIDAHAPEWGAGAFPGTDRLAKAANCSESTAYRRLSKLVELNLIQRASHGGGRGRSTTWSLNVKGISQFVSSNTLNLTENNEPAVENSETGDANPVTQDGNPVTAVRENPVTAVTEQGVYKAFKAKEEESRDPEPVENSTDPTPGAGHDARAPDLPELRWGGKKLELLGLEMWELAARSAGAVRLRLPSGLLIDVYTERDQHPRTVVLWREGGMQTTREERVSQILQKWNKEVDTFVKHVFEREGRGERDWSRGSAIGYPVPSTRFSERQGRLL